MGAVLIFSGVIKIGGGDKEALLSVPVTVWGTVPAPKWEETTRLAAQAGEKFNITYIEKSPITFESDLVDALASGTGPDMILAPHTTILRQKEKVYLLPYTAISERAFKDYFIQGAETLLAAGGTWGVPLYTDPLVMYWNRDMLARAGIPAPPKTWLEVQLFPAKLTRVDSSGTIIESAIALGGTSNVAHFKDILAAQIMQTGNPIVTRTVSSTEEGKTEDSFAVTLSDLGAAPSALRFYVEFANPALPKYSWNSAVKNSRDFFIAGKLALYLGTASELAGIREANPHLDFDVAEIPQIESGESRLTYADIYAFAIMKNSPNAAAAFASASKIALGATDATLAKALGVPTARRDLLSAGDMDPLQSVFGTAAVRSRTWFDPSSLITRNIFSDMVDSVMIGKTSPESAVSSADQRIQDLF